MAAEDSSISELTALINRMTANAKDDEERRTMIYGILSKIHEWMPIPAPESADFRPPEEHSRAVEIEQEAFDKAHLLLHRAHGILDLMFTLTITGQGSGVEELCNGTLTASLDAAMQQVNEAKELLISCS